VARFLLQCVIDQQKLDVFARLRADHYAFLIAQQHKIVFGGPTRTSDGGPPHTMIIVLESATADDAHAFIAAEPYNANGGFSEVVVRPWTQVLPETHAGELQQTYAAERRRAAAGEPERPRFAQTLPTKRGS
jgi:uncharacterized protein YciI